MAKNTQNVSVRVVADDETENSAKSVIENVHFPVIQLKTMIATHFLPHQGLYSFQPEIDEVPHWEKRKKRGKDEPKTLNLTTYQYYIVQEFRKLSSVKAAREEKAVDMTEQDVLDHISAFHRTAMGFLILT